MSRYLKINTKYSSSELKNHPKLINIDGVQSVENGNTGAINLVYGLSGLSNENVIVTYDSTKSLSSVQMRNYFQNKIIEANNSNNTSAVVNIDSPVEITKIEPGV